jgi:hypothetical protein
MCILDAIPVLHAHVELQDLFGAGMVPARQHETQNPVLIADVIHGVHVMLSQHAPGVSLTSPNQLSCRLDRVHHLLVLPKRHGKKIFRLGLALTGRNELSGLGTPPLQQ